MSSSLVFFFEGRNMYFLSAPSFYIKVCHIRIKSVVGIVDIVACCLLGALDVLAAAKLDPIGLQT